MNTYGALRASRVEGGIYAAAAKTQPSVKAEALRISATALKPDSALRARVEYALTQALYNADDTMVDGYGSPERLEYPTREAFWNTVFICSLQDVASREGKQVAKFFTSLHAECAYDQPQANIRRAARAALCLPHLVRTRAPGRNHVVGDIRHALHSLFTLEFAITDFSL